VTASSGYRRALTIAGSDSGGGAGIQADLKTFAALGCYGMSALTALTAQNTLGVQAIHPVPPAFITAQIDSVFSDIGADATKVGMVHSVPAIAAVAAGLRVHHAANVVVDPVMVATSGDPLLEPDALDMLRDVLVPAATVLTPNFPEAAMLLDVDDVQSDIEDACRALADLGADAVLVKGGHANSEQSVDVLYLSDSQHFTRFDAPRIKTDNTHGTGDTLSSAIAAHLARGAAIADAVADAKAYVTQALQAGANRPLGAGHGPVHHFYDVWDD
jgi:hydroxymethylpyrimidine/phosphomethylpyrimidine kinase